MEFRLLAAFRGLFDGQVYKHRNQALSLHVSNCLYEDILAVGPEVLRRSILERRSVVSPTNLPTGRSGRRGDGTFGPLVFGQPSYVEPGFEVMRGPVAAMEIGTELKILCKAMNRQVGRVKSDFKNQLREFRSKGSERVVSVAMVGINHAKSYASWEGAVEWKTTGSGKHLHPYQEANMVREKTQPKSSPSTMSC